MRQITLLSSVVIIGVVAIFVQPTNGRSPAREKPSGVSTRVERDDSIIRPVIHRKRETPVVRRVTERPTSRTGRSTLVDNRRRRRRRLTRSGDYFVSESIAETSYPKMKRASSNDSRMKKHVYQTLEPDFGRFDDSQWQDEGISFVPVRQSRRLNYPQMHDNAIDRGFMNENGIIFRYMHPKMVEQDVSNVEGSIAAVDANEDVADEDQMSSPEVSSSPVACPCCHDSLHLHGEDFYCPCRSRASVQDFSTMPVEYYMYPQTQFDVPPVSVEEEMLPMSGEVKGLLPVLVIQDLVNAPLDIMRLLRGPGSMVGDSTGDDDVDVDVNLDLAKSNDVQTDAAHAFTTSIN